MNRRAFLTRSGLGLLGTAGTCLGFQGDNNNKAEGWVAQSYEAIPDGSASKGMITARADQAIQKGLSYLNSRRDRDGSYGTGTYRGNVAIASLAGMAFMCGGSQPNRGPYGKIVTEALRFILSVVAVCYLAVDLLAVMVLVLDAVAFGLGWWDEWRPKHEEDLTRTMFPEDR